MSGVAEYISILMLQVQEWFDRASKMNEMCQAVNRLFQHLAFCNNRELLYDLYSYVWDIRGIVSLLNSYIKWLGVYKRNRKSYRSILCTLCVKLTLKFTAQIYFHFKQKKNIIQLSMSFTMQKQFNLSEYFPK